MSDCINVEMRELLPERLHEALDDAERTRVDAHLARCEECAAEYALLRSARDVMLASNIPRIDAAAIVAALPRPSRSPALSATRPNKAVWRIAAALTAVSLGGLSFVAIREVGSGRAQIPQLVDSTPISGGVTSSASSVATTAAPAITSMGVDSPVAMRSRGLSTGGGLADLADAQLEALLGDLDRIDAAPVAEPETISGSRLVTSNATGTED